MRYWPSARPRGCGLPSLGWGVCQEVTRTALLHPDIGPGVQKITLSFSHEGCVPRRNLRTWGTCRGWERPHPWPRRPLPPCRGPSSVGCKFGIYEPDSSRMPHTCLDHRGPPLLPSPLTSPTQCHLHCHSLLTPGPAVPLLIASMAARDMPHSARAPPAGTSGLLGQAATCHSCPLTPLRQLARPSTYGVLSRCVAS